MSDTHYVYIKYDAKKLTELAPLGTLECNETLLTDIAKLTAVPSATLFSSEEKARDFFSQSNDPSMLFICFLASSSFKDQLEKIELEVEFTQFNQDDFAKIENFLSPANCAGYICFEENNNQIKKTFCPMNLLTKTIHEDQQALTTLKKAKEQWDHSSPASFFILLTASLLANNVLKVNPLLSGFLYSLLLADVAWESYNSLQRDEIIKKMQPIADTLLVNQSLFKTQCEKNTGNQLVSYLSRPKI